LQLVMAILLLIFRSYVLHSQLSRDHIINTILGCRCHFVYDITSALVDLPRHHA
jgi:hypothetical protein